MDFLVKWIVIFFGAMFVDSAQRVLTATGDEQKVMQAILTIAIWTILIVIAIGLFFVFLSLFI